MLAARVFDRKSKFLTDCVYTTEKTDVTLSQLLWFTFTADDVIT